MSTQSAVERGRTVRDCPLRPAACNRYAAQTPLTPAARSTTATATPPCAALHLGRKEGWNIGQVRDWAGASALKFATVAPLLTWVSDNLAPAATLPAAAIAGPLRSPNLIFRQLFEPVTCTFTYLLACAATREAVLIDPVQEMADRDAKLLKELGLSLKYGINTHAHADHISGTHKLRAYYPGMKSVIGRASGAKADVHVEHGDTISFGLRSLKALSTPGHTNGCMSFLMDDSTAVFTGDALFVRGCGRTDFQAGDSRKLYRGIHEHLFTLPPATVVFPGHDYKGMLYSTIGEEAALNPRLTQSEEGFVELMANLGLPKPKQIDIAVPANLEDGVPQPVAAPAAPPA